ncbi:hypothetical protein PSI15_13350 [Xenorhabdus sp. PR6a]|uniref:hypothetical protein n=1 Tax=Xenorhabdus sp. PR6a TaxID=3025877 RepID=UPI0023588F21|nr:hypothetical protein [Xenorhabdus sp. PR6a]MDC9582540.1 hypothetical protein [Xenorhabdus sp. PR6a]
MMIDKIHSKMVQLFHQYIIGKLHPDFFSEEFDRYESQLFPEFLSERASSVQSYGQLIMLNRQAKEASSGAMKNLKESLTRLNHYQNIAALNISEHGAKGLLSGDKHAMQEFFSNSKNVEFVRQAYRLKHSPDNLSRPFFDSALIQLDEVFNARTCAAQQSGFSTYSDGKCALISDTQTVSVLKILNTFS